MQVCILGLGDEAHTKSLGMVEFESLRSWPSSDNFIIQINELRSVQKYGNTTLIIIIYMPCLSSDVVYILPTHESRSFAQPPLLVSLLALLIRQLTSTSGRSHRIGASFLFPWREIHGGGTEIFPLSGNSEVTRESFYSTTYLSFLYHLDI